MNEYDDFSQENIPDLPEELNYQVAQFEIHQQITKNWDNLKTILNSEELSEESKIKVDEFDKILKYWL